MPTDDHSDDSSTKADKPTGTTTDTEAVYLESPEEKDTTTTTTTSDSEPTE